MYCYWFFFKLNEGKLGRRKILYYKLALYRVFLYNLVAEVMSTQINSSSLTCKMILLYIYNYLHVFSPDKFSYPI